MSTRTSGLKRAGVGYKDNSIYARKRMPVFTVPSAAADRVISDAIAAFNRPADGQQRAVEKLVDREARIAVEGDTAMDDVPFGERGE